MLACLPVFFLRCAAKEEMGGLVECWAEISGLRLRIVNGMRAGGSLDEEQGKWAHQACLSCPTFTRYTLTVRAFMSGHILRVSPGETRKIYGGFAVT